MKIQINVSANDFVYNLDVDTQTNFFVCNGNPKNLNAFEFKEKLFDFRKRVFPERPGTVYCKASFGVYSDFVFDFGIGFLCNSVA